MPNWFSHTQIFVTLKIVAHQAPLPMGFSRQEYWSGLPWPLPGDLPDPGIEPPSLISPALAGGFFTTGTTWEAQTSHVNSFIVLKVRSPSLVLVAEIKVLVESCSLWKLWEKSIPCLFWLLKAAVIPQLVAASRQSLPSWSHCLPLFYL